jgi:hypothetical protein
MREKIIFSTYNINQNNNNVIQSNNKSIILRINRNNQSNYNILSHKLIYNNILTSGKNLRLHK